MKSHVAIDAALRDPQLLGAALGDLRSWAMWVATLTAAFGERLSKREREAFAKVAGDREPPSKRVRELWAVIGRRSGKSRMASALAVFLATLTDCRSKLAKGEQGVVLVLAPSVDQAKVIFDYARGFIEASPLLASQLEGEPTATDLRLRGGVTIACRPNNFRTVRGRTLLAAIFDECAYWRDETSALPDVETYRAVLPALATTNGLLIGIGSPYRKTGLLHQKHRDHYGVEGDDVLCVTGESRTFNPMLDPAVIEQAERDDPEAAASEWRAEFRSDLASLLDDAVIDGAIDHARPLELPPRYGVTYHAFTDASAGRHDAFALCVGHVEKDHFIADVLRATRPPFDPGIVAGEYAALAKDPSWRPLVREHQLTHSEEGPVKMKDNDFSELQLKAIIVPQEARWPNNVLHWQMLHDVVNEARVGVAQALTAMDDIEKDHDLSPEGKDRQKKKLASEAIAEFGHSKALTAAKEASNRQLAKWAEKTGLAVAVKAPANIAEAVVQSEIRAHLAAMKGSKIDFLRTHATDPVVASAILGAPGFLSGLSEAEITIVRHRIDEHVAPEIAKARDATLEAMKEAEQGWQKAIDKIGERAGLTQGPDGKWRDPSMSAAA